MPFRFIPAASEEKVFLHGPASRFAEFLRALRVFYEYIRGFRTLHFVGPCITVFGSARIANTDPRYDQARELGFALAKAGYSVMTGGGPGLMEAANRGAKEAGGRSIGLMIVLPHEERPNRFLDTFITFRYFFVRKLMLAKYSRAFIALPGGFGTLDELFEIVTLIQTRKIDNYPVILMGREFWNPLMEFIHGTLDRQGLVNTNDLEKIHLTDSVAEAVAWATAPLGQISQGGTPTGKKNYRPRWFLLERGPTPKK